jgi:DNA-directed RNA polymerases I, II, and III subunit RPABC1
MLLYFNKKIRIHSVSTVKMEDIFNKINSSCTYDTGDVSNTMKAILRTCREIVFDRGYTNISTYDPYHGCMQSSPVIKANDGNGCELFVYWHNEERIGIKFIRQLDELQTKTGRNVILLSVEGPTAFSKKECDCRNWLQMLLYKELYINITKHSLVPKHRKLALDEIPELKSRYSLSESMQELPKLPVSDPICKYYKFDRGNVVEIERTVGALEKGKYYRIVQ